MTGSGTVWARYTYDAWGKQLQVLNGENKPLGSTSDYFANANPFRYRGYYCDVETGFYYLQSRYYDPSIGRFINADNQVDTSLPSGFNLFSYCSNNPANNTDSDGHFAISIAAIAAIAFVAIAAIAAATYASKQIEKAPSLPISQSISCLKEKLEPKANYTVYKLVDTTDNSVKYVGRTKNVEAREKAHQKNPNRKDLAFQIIEENLTYEAARGLEQAYMVHYHTINTKNPMNNQINGINPKYGKLMLYVESAWDYLENQVSNEFLNWIGM